MCCQRIAQHTVWVSLLPRPSCCFSPTLEPRWPHRVTEIRPLTVSQLLVQHLAHSKEALCHGDAPSLPAVLLRLRAQLHLLGCIGLRLYGHPPLCQSLLMGDQDNSSGLRSRALSAETHLACPVQRQPPRLLSSSSTCSFPLWHMCFPDWCSLLGCKLQECQDLSCFLSHAIDDTWLAQRRHMMKTCLLIEHGRIWEEAVFTGQNQRNGNPTDVIWVIKAQDKHKAPYPLLLTRHRQTSAKGKLQPGPWNLIVSFLNEEGGHSRFMCSSFTHSLYTHPSTYPVPWQMFP